jgi:pimeloyl-ACP methyl ester carboxylesterase
MVRNSVQKQFGPGFPVPQQSVLDVRRMTYTSYADSLNEFHRFLDTAPLSTRAARLGMPILVIWGGRDQLVKSQALDDYRSLPGVRIALVAGAGHSAMIERPSQTTQLILGWQHSRCTANRHPVLCS